MGKRVFDKADFYLRRGDRKRLGRLLRKHRYLLNSQNSMLVYRAVWQFQGMLPWLLAQGVHPDCKMSPTDGTPLMHAAAEGELHTMRLLLDHGADPNARNDRNELPLGFACSYEQWEAAELLVERGADVNGIEEEGKTHLDWLAIAKSERGIQVLRALGGRSYVELNQINHL
jgi:ankyrin repeat protein